MRNKKQSERGHALMESALVLVTTLTMLIGAMDFGQVMFFHQGLAERAQAAAHWAAANPYNATQIANVAVYNKASVAVGDRAILSGLTTGMVTSSLAGAGTKDAMVEVRIQNYPYRFFSPWIAGAYTASPIVVKLTHEASLP
jgi:hypothetical protein